MGGGDFVWPKTVTENRYNERTSSHLEQVLRFREDCNVGTNGKKKALRSVLNREKKSSPEIRSGRTLIDIIQSDSTGENRKTWRYFRDKLPLKRAGAAWNSTVQISVPEIEKMKRSSSISTSNSMNNRMLRHPSTKIPTSDPDFDSPSGRNRSGRFHRNISGLSDEENLENKKVTDETEAITPVDGDEEEEEEEGGDDDGGGSAKMSLMALLAETDREMGVEGSAYMMGDEEEDDDEEEEGGGNVDEGEYNNCCVCVVRHKGSASTPCKHTFCRLCSKELSVQRGNCPLCNGYITEILDIF